MKSQKAESSDFQPATAPEIIELDDQNFGPFIDGHPFAVVHFWAPSSAPCRAFAPSFAAAAARHPDALFVKVNAQAQRALAAQFKIQSLPTLLIFRSNIIVYAKPGALAPKALDDLLGSARKLDMEQVRRQVVSVDEIKTGAPPTHSTPAAKGQLQAPPAADPRLSIENVLHPSLRGTGLPLQDIRSQLQAGGVVAIRDAFDPEFAERMYRSLDECTSWRLHENYAERFSYHHHNVYHPEEFPQDITYCSKVFDSQNSRAWASRLSGRTCLGPTSISTSWYLPGDHSLPHSDNVTTGAHFIRQLAFVWHLSKDWRPEWGGALYWCPTATYLPSSFNTLYLFNVTPESTHFVTQVSPYAQGKRLTINGWWTGPNATGEPLWTGPDRMGSEDSGVLAY